MEERERCYTFILSRTPHESSQAISKQIYILALSKHVPDEIESASTGSVRGVHGASEGPPQQERQLEQSSDDVTCSMPLEKLPPRGGHTHTPRLKKTHDMRTPSSVLLSAPERTS
jgi:hypothetical protein